MKTLTHKFVESLPEPLEDGVVYVSIRFRLVAHNCCCGCRQPVVLNLAPNGWKLTFDGKSVSLSPSIGNWSLPCRSHYWITKNAVEWAETWSDTKVMRANKKESQEIKSETTQVSPESSTEGLWKRLLRRVRKG